MRAFQRVQAMAKAAGRVADGDHSKIDYAGEPPLLHQQVAGAEVTVDP
jgi:hypothetical protein